jgi:hypothetical protein
MGILARGRTARVRAVAPWGVAAVVVELTGRHGRRVGTLSRYVGNRTHGSAFGVGARALSRAWRAIKDAH